VSQVCQRRCLSTVLSRAGANLIVPCHFNRSKVAVWDIKGSQGRDFKYAQLLMFIAHNQGVGRLTRIAEVNDNEDMLLWSYCIHPTIDELRSAYFQRQFLLSIPGKHTPQASHRVRAVPREVPIRRVR